MLKRGDSLRDVALRRKDDGSQVIENKDIWTLICRYLGEREIVSLNQLNKRFNSMISGNILIWENLSTSHQPIYPVFKTTVAEYRILEDYWRCGRDCGEKKEYIKHKLREKNIKAIPRDKFKNVKLITLMENIISYFMMFTPLMLFLFVSMLECKLLFNFKITHFACFMPSLFYFFLLMTLCLFYLVSIKKKEREKLYLFNITIKSSKLALICSISTIFFACVFFSSVIYKLDIYPDHSINYIMCFLYLFFFFLSFSVYFGTKSISSSRKSFVWIIIFFAASFSAMVHLSLANILPSSIKWQLTFAPFFFLDLIFIVLSLFVAIFLMIWNKCELPLNLCFILFAFNFVFASVSLCTSLSFGLSLVYYFSFAQISLASLQVFIVYCKVFIYNNFGVTALSYLILHGTYGLLWLLKDFVNGDKNWTKSISLSSVLIIVSFLVCYGFIAVVTISNKEECHPVIIVLAFYVNIVGVFFTFSSDFQKNSILKIRSGLITDGLFKYSRNPNYFGEILIYLSFVMLSRSVYVYVYIISIWVFYFYPRMLMKDKSISRHKGWKEYKESTNLLFPKIF